MKVAPEGALGMERFVAHLWGIKCGRANPLYYWRITRCGEQAEVFSSPEGESHHRAERSERRAENALLASSQRRGPVAAHLRPRGARSRNLAAPRLEVGLGRWPPGRLPRAFQRPGAVGGNCKSIRHHQESDSRSEEVTAAAFQLCDRNPTFFAPVTPRSKEFNKSAS